METNFETAGTAIYRGKVKVAQCLDRDAGELFGDNILPREEWRDLLPDYQQATANADTLVYRANHYHELRTKCDDLLAALAHVDEYATRQSSLKTDEGALWAQCASIARAAIAKVTA